MEQESYNEACFKRIAGDGVAEDFNFMPRSNLGMRKWGVSPVTAWQKILTLCRAAIWACASGRLKHVTLTEPVKL